MYFFAGFFSFLYPCLVHYYRGKSWKSLQIEIFQVFFFSYTCCIFITKQLQLDRIKLNSFSCFGWVYYFCFFSLMLSVLKKHFDCLSWLNNLLGKESFSICFFFLSPLVLCFFWKKNIVCDEKVLRFLICWVLIPQKWKKAKNSNGVYLTKFAGSTYNHKKMIGTSNQPIETKKVIKKVCLVSQKEPKIRPKILQKIIGTSNQPIRTKISAR
jgi:hypothetical protein